MISHFFDMLVRDGQDATSVYRLCNEEEDQNLPHWKNLERVYIPICLRPHHWVLGVLQLNEMTMVIYDNFRINRFELHLSQLMGHFCQRLPKLFRLIGDTGRYNRSKKLRWMYADNAPQQSGRYGNCGV